MAVDRQYDSELQMFRQAVREPNREALIFLRWMAEGGKLEHEVSGPPSGEYAIWSPMATRREIVHSPRTSQPKQNP